MQSGRRRRGVNLLLVGENPGWHQAVGSTLTAMGSAAGSAGCGVRGAVARLAGGHEEYSHLLPQPGSAEGLLGEPVDLAGPVAATEVILLGDEVPHLRLASVPASVQPLLTAALKARAAGCDGKSTSGIELNGALAAARIEARYQPIVRVADGRPVALETLARLHHPEHGLLPPGTFVPQMEQAGLSAWLAETVTALGLAGFMGPSLREGGLQLTLNMPLEVVLSDAALDRLDGQQQAAGVPPDALVIELTESQPVDHLAPLARAVERLRGAGYGVSIDDIGPAVRNWAALLTLPFTAVKLDKDLVRASLKNSDALRFVNRIIGAGRGRGLTVIAEGVETTALWHHVRGLGVDQAQGFLIARPLPVAAVPVWLEAWGAQVQHDHPPSGLRN
jgi:EAL domain-containing protein (putative c-di-GMP-specific phosphodiesterase class I)